MHFNLLAIAFGLLSLHAFAAPIANISSPDIPSSNITFAGNDTIDPDEIARFKGSKSFSIFGFRDVAGSGSQQRRDDETEVDDDSEEPSLLSPPDSNSTLPHETLGGGVGDSLEIIGFRR